MEIRFAKKLHRFTIYYKAAVVYVWNLSYSYQKTAEFCLLSIFVQIYGFFSPVVHNRKINYNSRFGNSETTEFQLTCPIK